MRSVGELSGTSSENVSSCDLLPFAPYFLENCTKAARSGFHCVVRLEPSKAATIRIFDWGSRIALEERTIEAMAISGIREYLWLAEAREIG